MLHCHSLKSRSQTLCTWSCYQLNTTNQRRSHINHSPLPPWLPCLSGSEAPPVAPVPGPSPCAGTVSWRQQLCPCLLLWEDWHHRCYGHPCCPAMPPCLLANPPALESSSLDRTGHLPSALPGVRSREQMLRRAVRPLLGDPPGWCFHHGCESCSSTTFPAHCHPHPLLHCRRFEAPFCLWKESSPGIGTVGGWRSA